MIITVKIGGIDQKYAVSEGQTASAVLGNPEFQAQFSVGENVEPVVNGTCADAVLKENDTLSAAPKGAEKGDSR